MWAFEIIIYLLNTVVNYYCTTNIIERLSWWFQKASSQESKLRYEVETKAMILEVTSAIRPKPKYKAETAAEEVKLSSIAIEIDGY